MINSQQWGNWWSTLLTVDPRGRINSQQWEGQQSTVRGSTVNSEAINDQQSTVRGLMVNSEVINDQWSTVRGSMVNSEAINTFDCWFWGGGSTVNSEEGQQWTVRQSMINSEQWEGQWSNSEAIDDQWSTVRQSMINTVDCWSWGEDNSTINSERVNGQQWGDWRSMVNSEAINDQHLPADLGGIENWCGEDQQSVALWVYHDASWVMLCPVPVKFRCIGLQNMCEIWDISMY